ncbi:MAG: DUF505 family protein [Candidatus Korarchaeota archaeon]|nr:DUF505 family protein [Candidatus Korarchaeota archaeon]
MLIRRDHLKLLLRLGEGGREALEFRGEEGVDELAFSRRVTELKVLGLVDISDGTINLTSAGRKLVEALRRAELDVESLPDVWVDTPIYKMVELAVRTGHILPNWESALRERGFWEDGPTDLARELLEVKVQSRPSLLLAAELSDFIEVIPPGPEDLGELIRIRDELGFGKWVVNALQAMDLLYISPPDEFGAVYTLTPAGRRARESIWLISVVTTQITVDQRTAEQIERGESTERLVEMGLADGRGITEAGRGMLAAYKEMGVVRRPTTPFYFTIEEIKVLKAIEEAERKKETNPEILPTKGWIEDKSGIADVGEALILLESKGLVERREIEMKDTYWLTGHGRQAYNLVKDSSEDITSESLKAVTYPLADEVPMAEWVRQAKRHGFVDKDLTKKGRLLVDLSSRVVRRPVLTAYDVAILMKIPKGKYLRRDELVSAVNEYLGVKDDEEAKRIVRKAISEAESKGLVVMLQNRTIGLTPIGEVMKDVVSFGNTQTMKTMKFPVTPTVYWVLRVISENIEELKEAWRKGVDVVNVEARIVYNNLKKYTSVTDEEIKKAFVILRRTGLLGKMGPTSAGELLLEAGRMFERLPEEERWVREVG